MESNEQENKNKDCKKDGKMNVGIVRRVDHGGGVGKGGRLRIPRMRS